MKILLIGDYSSVHKNLKDGLEQLGHTVVLTSNGDKWKEIPGRDYSMTPNINTSNHLHSRVFRAVYNMAHKYTFTEPYFVMLFYLRLCIKYKFNVIHVISADLFPFWYRKRIYKFLIFLSNNRLFVSIPGDDWYIYQAWKKGNFRYMSFDNNPVQTSRFDGISEISKIENEAYQYTIKHSKALIPLCPYETEIPYQGFSNLRKVIQLPINVDSIKYFDNKIVDKIRIYHGISYGDNKGSGYILDALEIIKEKYGNLVEIVTTNRISYEEFLEKLQECNVYIDQCKSYSYGMSAVIAMAMGKVVLSGKETEIIPRLEGHDCPVINIIPETDQIVYELEKLIDNANTIEAIGLCGRRFTEEFHDCKLVASRYLDEWNR